MRTMYISQPDAYRALIDQGKDRGQAVRAIAWSTYGADSGEARSFMVGWRASLEFGDDLERHEAEHSARYGRSRGNAFSDGWVLAAVVA